jgi:protein O-GlcNAc transferase
VSLSTEETLLLERYLILQRGAILTRSSWQDCPEFFAHIPLREINLILWLREEDFKDESILESLFEVILSHNFTSWFSWLIVAESKILEEIQLYLSFLEPESSPVNSAPDLAPDLAPDSDPDSQVSLTYLEPDSFFNILETIQPRLHGVCFPQPNVTLPEPWRTPLKRLPQFTFNPEVPLLQTLYDAHIDTANGWMKTAQAVLQTQDLPTAIEAYHHAIAFNPFSSILWLELGKVYLLQQQPDLAKAAVLKGMKMDRPQSLNHQLLGTIYEAQQQWQFALVAYQNSLDLDPDNIDSYCFLGNVLAQLNEPDAAENIYHRGLERSIWHWGLYLNLGNLLFKQNRREEAVKIYKKALRLSPYNLDILNNLAIAYEDPAWQQFGQARRWVAQDKDSEAIEAYHRALALDPNHFDSIVGLCESLQRLGDFDAVRRWSQQTLEKISHFATLPSLNSSLDLPSTSSLETSLDIPILQRILLCLNKQSDSHLSRQWVQNYQFFKIPTIQTFLEKINAPILYDTVEEIDAYRQAFMEALTLVHQLDFSQPQIQAELLQFLRAFVHAFFNYQCRNDRGLQQCYAQMIEKLLQARYPQWYLPHQSGDQLPNDQSQNPANTQSPQKLQNIPRKIRIGYLSAYLRRHNGSRWALGWIQNHPRDQFEVYTYHLGTPLDSDSQKFAEASAVFRSLLEEDFEGFEAWFAHTVETLKEDKLDILIFPDIGMEPRTMLLSKLRLAPVQCTAWGHPVTSGSSSIDYYLSSHLMESDLAQDHYTETLVRLPHLGLCYPRPIIPDPKEDRSFFQLPQDRIIYLSCQSLFKYLPQYDWIYAAIAHQVPQAYFVFLETFALKHQFHQRLAPHFDKLGLNIEAYCHILPKQSWYHYIQLQHLADIYLDTLEWTGGNSTLEAILCGLPVVTAVGEQMRGRHSYAILQRLGMTATLAHSLEEYVAIAIELGRNDRWRGEIAAQYRARAARLFDDASVAHALNRVLLSLVTRKIGVLRVE